MTTPELRFGGRLAHVGRPPLFRVAALMALALGASGCIGGGEPLPVAVPSAPIEADTRRLGALAEALAEAETPDEREAVLAGALRSSGVAPLADASVPGGVERFRIDGQLAGWIIGRQPVRRDTLVVAIAPRDGTSDLALIEAARLLVARGVYTQTPERSVLVVIGDDATPALRLWDRSMVLAAVRVGPGPDSLAGRRVQTLAPGEPADLAVRFYRALARETTPRGSIYTPAADFGE